MEGYLQSKRFVYLHENGSVHSSPPDTGSTGKFCVCVRQNVTKQAIFLES